MLKFIARRVSRRDDQREARDSPAIPGEASDGAQRQAAEDRVLRNVGAFSNEKMEAIDGRIGKMGEEPTEERLDESPGVAGGSAVGGPVENEPHPKEEGEP